MRSRWSYLSRRVHLRDWRVLGTIQTRIFLITRSMIFNNLNRNHCSAKEESHQLCDICHLIHLLMIKSLPGLPIEWQRSQRNKLWEIIAPRYSQAILKAQSQNHIDKLESLILLFAMMTSSVPSQTMPKSSRRKFKLFQLMAQRLLIMALPWFSSDPKYKNRSSSGIHWTEMILREREQSKMRRRVGTQWKLTILKARSHWSHTLWEKEKTNLILWTIEMLLKRKVIRDDFRLILWILITSLTEHNLRFIQQWSMLVKCQQQWLDLKAELVLTAPPQELA